ncbi:MAG: hypothetical protein Q9222_001877, partial [Ikaeria aurantiellina]
MVTNPQIHLMSDPMYMASENLLYSQHGLDLNNFYIPGLASAGISQMPLSTDTFQTETTYAPSSIPLTSAPTEPFSAPYSEPPHPVISPPPLEPPWSSGAFRPSMYQVENQFRHVFETRPEPCQTEAMRQGGEDPAHFRNKNFQPQIWEPDADYNTGRSSEPNRR